MDLFEVRIDPCDDMILERPLDDLMQQVRRKHLIYVGSWESVSEWLGKI